MASFQIRQRDPLLDQNTQAMLERRGRELIGLGLLALALLFTLMLWSYSPEDPGWMVATQEPARNILGRFGAAISSTLVILIGRGAWSIPLILMAWGLRFMLHRGAERVLGRIVFAVIGVALAAAYSSTLVAPEGWPHTFGLGGLFGDTVAGALIGVIPGSAGFGLKLLSLVTFFALMAMLLFVTGFDRAELRFMRQVLFYGSIMAYSTAMQALGKGASGALTGAMDRGRDLAERRRTARAEALAAAAEAPLPKQMPGQMQQFAPQPLTAGRTSVVRRAPPPVVEEMGQTHAQPRPSATYAPEPLGAEPAWNAPSTLRAEPRHFEAPAELPKEKMGFLQRMKSVVKPDPELVEPELPEWAETDQPSEDRIKARISDVIRSRARSGTPVGAASAHGMTPIQAAIAARRAEPPVVRPRGPKPLIADTRPGTRPPTYMNAAMAAGGQGAADVVAPAWGMAMAAQDAGYSDALSGADAFVPALGHDAHDTDFSNRVDTAPVAPQLAGAQSSAAFSAEDAGWMQEEASYGESWSTAREQLYEEDAVYGDAPDEVWASDWQPDARYEPDYDPTPVTPSPAPRGHAPALGPAPSRIGNFATAPAATAGAMQSPIAPRFEADHVGREYYGNEGAAPVQTGSRMPEAAYPEEEDFAPYPEEDHAAPPYEPSRIEMPRVAPPPIPVHAPAAHLAPAHLAPVNAAVLDRRPIVQPNAVKPLHPAPRARDEAEQRMRFEEAAAPAYELPPLSLLASASTVQRNPLSDEALEENARMLESVLDDYGVKGEIVSVRPGPVVTMYELEPAPGLKASRVIGLADDIARSMSALSARVSTVPGRTVIGIELPNTHREKVVLREIIAARAFGDGQQTLPLALGKDIGGEAVVANLAKMPHLLIAGTTGSGKSVAINTMILSLLYKLTPDECRLIMIDPKMLELSVYDGIPHLLSPVVTDPKKAVVALKWVVGEMEERYRKMSKMGVRNIEGYNARVREALDKGEMFKRTIQTGFDDETGDPVFETDEFAPQAFPYIVVIVDEMADLMMVAGKEIEACIQRLAQMARASGIHLIMATQRPSVDVITGTIKANFPTRISFQVTSKIDSRTILGEMGAEQLLGQGDMLYMGNGARITRIHGPFVSDEEVEEIVNHLKSFGPPTYMSGVVEGPDEENASEIDQVLGLGGNTDGEDALYDQAVAIVAKDRKCSTSYIQRKLGIGYNKAARLVEQMEENSVVTPANHVGKREILIPET